HQCPHRLRTHERGLFTGRLRNHQFPIGAWRRRNDGGGGDPFAEGIGNEIILETRQSLGTRELLLSSRTLRTRELLATPTHPGNSGALALVTHPGNAGAPALVTHPGNSGAPVLVKHLIYTLTLWVLKKYTFFPLLPKNGSS